MIVRSLIPFCLAASLMAQTLDRTKPPVTPPLQPYKLPAARESKLPNGLSIMLVEDKRFPLVTLRLAFRAGSRYDPAAKPGVAETLASLITSGTPTRGSRRIAEELALIGGSLDASDNPDALIVSGSVLADNTGKLLDLMADVIRNGSFPQGELDLRKGNRVQELSYQLSQSSTLANEKLHAVLFGSHPYGQTLPTPASIKAIERQDLLDFRDKLLTPGNAVLILVGAIPPAEQALEMIRTRLASWANKPAPGAPGGGIPAPQRSITLIDRPGSAQVDILVGHVTVNRKHPDYFPLLMGDGILGGGASSRLFQNIREKKGYAYHANSHHMPYKDSGMFQITTQVREEVLEPAVTAVFEEMDRMGKEPVTSQELTDKKNYLNGTFVMRLASQDGVANQLASLRMNDMAMDYLEQYVTRIRSVEPDQIQRVSKQYLSPGDASVVIVGDASKIGKTVEKFGKVTVEKGEMKKLISRKLLLHTPLFDVTDNRLIDPDGADIHRILVEHGGSAVVLPVDEAGRVLLVRQYRFPARGYLWELPAGKMDAGETALQAAKRELREETGYRARNWRKLVRYYASPGFQQETMTIFLATGLKDGVAQLDHGEENLTSKWFEPDWIDCQIRKGKICDGKTIIGMYFLNTLSTAGTAG